MGEKRKFKFQGPSSGKELLSFAESPQAVQSTSKESDVRP